MTHGSLFSGIGGWSIGSDAMGWETVFNCEINSFCQKILRYYWPNAKLYEDITKTDFSEWRGEIDILSNSFPCQGFSVAGQQRGTSDERYLWPESLRAIKEIQPTWVISENVHGIVNSERGMVFEQVQTDLEAAGYEVFTYVLPACGVNAPHRRDRVWFVAHSIRTTSGVKSRKIGDERGKTNEDRGKGIRQIHREVSASGIDSTGRITPNSSGVGRKPGTPIRGEIPEKSRRTKPNFGDKSQIITNSGRIGSQGAKQQTAGFEQCNEGNVADTEEQGYKGTDTERKASEGRRTMQHIGFDRFPTQSPLCSRDDGISSELDGITFPKWRNESIKAYGNAIVPIVALQIFKAIEEYSLTTEKCIK
jgi:DNA (cytosine-5)-methyltransferase 1